MFKIENLKAEILKEARIEKYFQPILLLARRKVENLENKAKFYRKQASDLDTQFAALDGEIRDGLAAGKGDLADKVIGRRSALREKKRELEDLAVEVENVMLPPAQAAIEDAEKKLHEALQEAVMIRHNAVQDELNARLSEIEADLSIWTEAVSTLPTSTLFAGMSIVLKNSTIRHALGW